MPASSRAPVPWPSCSVRLRDRILLAKVVAAEIEMRSLIVGILLLRAFRDTLFAFGTSPLTPAWFARITGSPLRTPCRQGYGFVEMLEEFLGCWGSVGASEFGRSEI